MPTLLQVKRRAAAKRRYRENPEKYRVKSRAWYKAHAESARQYQREYYQRNRGEILSEKREWRLSHPVEQLAYSTKWKQSHREENVRRSLQWQKDNPEKANERSRRRRARKRLLTPDVITDMELVALLVRQKNVCFYCKATLSGKKHLDHMLPLVKGGTHSLTNLAWACASCNLRKGTMTSKEFTEKIA